MPMLKYAFIFGFVFTFFTYSQTTTKAYAQNVPTVKNDKKETQKNKVYYWQIPGFKESFIDDNYAIYHKRLYQGIIPDMRDAIPTLRVPKGKNFVTWIGYQHKKLYSRIFIQTSKIAQFIVTQKTPTHIVLKIKKASFINNNTKRIIDTKAFNTKITRIVPTSGKKHSSIINIYLKEPCGFLYKQAGNYIFVDVEKNVK